MTYSMKRLEYKGISFMKEQEKAFNENDISRRSFEYITITEEFLSTEDFLNKFCV